jgi:hypothetical protein
LVINFVRNFHLAEKLGNFSSPNCNDGLTMAERPASPTELSYTQLAKIAPPSLDRRRVVSSSAVNNPAPFSSSSVPPSFVGVPNTNEVGGWQQMTATSTMPPPPHRIPPTSTPVPFRIETTSVSAPPLRWANGEMNNNSIHPHSHTTTITTPMNNDAHNMEDRVSKLAWRLQMDIPPPSSVPSTNYQQDPRFEEIRQFIDSLKSMQLAVTNTLDESQRTKKSRALNTLLNMFERVLETSSKSVAAGAASSSSTTDQQSIENQEDSVIQQHLEATVQQLTNDNRQLSTHCREKDNQMQHLTDEIRRLRLECGRLGDENDRLRSIEIRAREECTREREQAHVALEAATAAEHVRDGILADYARLTEENVELKRNASNAKVVDDTTVVELEACRAEMKRLRDIRDRMDNELRKRMAEIVELRRDVANDKLFDNNLAVVTDQLETCRVEITRLQNVHDKTIVELQRKTNELVNVERRMDELHDTLISERQERRRLEEELNNSRRSATNASEQLLRLREQFSKARTTREEEEEDCRSIMLSVIKPNDDVSTTRSKSSTQEQKGLGETLEGMMTMLSSRSLSSSYQGIIDKATIPSLSSHGRGVRMEEDIMPMTTTNNDDDLRVRVDELNAQLDDLISPRSGKSSLDWTRHGITTATSLQNSKSNRGDDALLSPTTSDASSQRGRGVIRDGLSMTTATTTTTIADDARKSRFMKNNSTVDELIGEYSLDGIDSIKEDIIFSNGGAGMKRTMTHHREENAHPNHLMEYFYGQIKHAK